MKTQLQQANALPLAVPGHDLDAYIRAVNSVPVLSVDEERQLTERLYFDEDLDAAVAAYTGPVLAVRLADDALAPEASVKAVTDKFRNTRLSQRLITAEQLGDRADHFRWARQARLVADLVTPFVAGPR